MDKYSLIMLTLLIGSLVGAFYLGTQVEVIKEASSYVIPNKEITNQVDCTNLSLEETTKCLVDYVTPFYNYTSRSDIDRSLEDIKLNGGDCYDYSHIYDKMAKDLGFSSEVVIIDTGNITAHAIEIISTEKGYCTIDQLNYHCVRLI